MADVRTEFEARTAFFREVTLARVKLPHEKNVLERAERSFELMKKIKGSGKYPELAHLGVSCRLKHGNTETEEVKDKPHGSSLNMALSLNGKDEFTVYKPKRSRMNAHQLPESPE